MSPRTIILDYKDIYNRTYSVSNGDVVSRQDRWCLLQKRNGWSDSNNCREIVQEYVRTMAHDDDVGSSLLLVYNRNLALAHALKSAKLLKKVLNNVVPPKPKKKWGGEVVLVEQGNNTRLGVLEPPTSLWTSKFPYPHIMFSLMVAAEESARRLISPQGRFFSSRSNIWEGVDWPFSGFRKNAVFLNHLLLAEQAKPFLFPGETYGLRRAMERHGKSVVKEAISTMAKG